MQLPAKHVSQFCPRNRSDQALAKDPTGMLGSSTLTSLEYDLVSNHIQRGQQLDFRELSSFTREIVLFFHVRLVGPKSQKNSRTQGVPAAEEGLNRVMKSWRGFRRITAFLRAQVSKLRTSSLRYS